MKVLTIASLWLIAISNEPIALAVLAAWGCYGVAALFNAVAKEGNW